MFLLSQISSSRGRERLARIETMSSGKSEKEPI
jgi:hypothetical protein